MHAYVPCVHLHSLSLSYFVMSYKGGVYSVNVAESDTYNCNRYSNRILLLLYNYYITILIILARQDVIYSKHLFYTFSQIYTNT